MNHNEIIQSVRAEIAKLQRVLDLLVDGSSDVEAVRRPGRPKASATRATGFNPEEFAPKKRTMSAEGKARIAAAQKKRWAAQKAASSDRTAPEQVLPAKRSSTTGPRKSAGKAAPAPAKKRAGAAKKRASTSAKARSASAKPSATVATRKKAAKKIVAKKTSAPAAKRSARQVAQAEPEPQRTT